MSITKWNGGGMGVRVSCIINYQAERLRKINDGGALMVIVHFLECEAKRLFISQRTK
jgi:hypothetical protein